MLRSCLLTPLHCHSLQALSVESIEVQSVILHKLKTKFCPLHRNITFDKLSLNIKTTIYRILSKHPVVHMYTILNIEY